jgi:hypothetical protein
MSVTAGQPQYAGYLNSRLHGRTSTQATRDANDHMAGLGIKIPPEAVSGVPPVR